MSEYASLINHPVEIVVATMLDNEWRWFVSERDYWFLDLRKLRRASGSGDEPHAGARFGIPAVDVNNARTFLLAMDRFRVSVDELRLFFRDKLPARDWDGVIDFVPSLFVNFDNRTLMSLYGEPTSFERYVPDGWHGSYDDFLPLVPEAERYWVVDGLDWFALLMNRS